MIISNFDELVREFFSLVANNCTNIADGSVLNAGGVNGSAVSGNGVKSMCIRLYNEFSLQHEFGLFLRKKFPGYYVEFERNVDFFGIVKKTTTKKEIDIVIYNADKSEKCAIELKYPRNGQYPVQMYSFVKDIKFMEELKAEGFETYVLTLADDSLFYSRGDKGTGATGGIYEYFRVKYYVPGSMAIKEPTGSKSGSITLSSTYNFVWQSARWDDGEPNTPYGKQKYYCITI